MTVLVNCRRWVVKLSLALLLTLTVPKQAQTASQEQAANDGAAVRGVTHRQIIIDQIFVEITSLLAEADAVRLVQRLTGKRSKLSPADRTMLESVSNKLNVPAIRLQQWLQTIQKAAVSPHNILYKISEMSNEHQEFVRTLGVVRGNDSLFALLHEKALVAAETGDYELARTVLTRGRRQLTTKSLKAKGFSGQDAVGMAHLNAALARLSLMQLDYRGAAAHFSHAYAAMPPDHTSARHLYMGAQADALQRLGDTKGDKTALREAADLYRQRLDRISRKESPTIWAAAQHDLGNVLALLGERERSIALLREALAAYRDAIDGYSPQSTPLDWAAVHHDLGVALWQL
jgi:tetratricopeptide (TPR) repeat protein